MFRHEDIYVGGFCCDRYDQIAGGEPTWVLLELALSAVLKQVQIFFKHENLNGLYESKLVLWRENPKSWPFYQWNFLQVQDQIIVEYFSHWGSSRVESERFMP